MKPFMFVLLTIIGLSLTILSFVVPTEQSPAVVIDPALRLVELDNFPDNAEPGTLIFKDNDLWIRKAHRWSKVD